MIYLRRMAPLLSCICLLAFFCGCTTPPSNRSPEGTTTNTSPYATTTPSLLREEDLSPVVEGLRTILQNYLFSTYGETLPATYGGVYTTANSLVVLITEETGETEFRAVLTDDAIRQELEAWYTKVHMEPDSEKAVAYRQREWIHYVSVTYSLDFLNKVAEKIDALPDVSFFSVDVSVTENRVHAAIVPDGNLSEAEESLRNALSQEELAAVVLGQAELL